MSIPTHLTYDAEHVEPFQLRPRGEHASASPCRQPHASPCDVVGAYPEAEEGRDYELEMLMPFWQLTSEQDWELCEFAQTGINSRAYRPGPYSPHKEYNVDAFVRWYLEVLKQ